MPLKMRPTGLGHGVYKDNVDYGVFCGEWCIGRIYETRTGPCRSVLVLAMASAEYGPCLRAFWLPPRSPGDRPPCMRHRPFGMAGDRQRLPLRVRAPH